MRDKRINNIWIYIGTLGIVGFSPFIPGSLGALLGIPFWILFAPFIGRLGILFLLVLFFIIGLIAGNRAIQFFNNDDPRQIIIDETTGLLFVLWLSPLYPGKYSWGWITLEIIVAFILFRFFDIIKPWPVNLVQDKVKGGIGIMLDDIVAGICSEVVLWITYFAWGPYK